MCNDVLTLWYKQKLVFLSELQAVGFDLDYYYLCPFKVSALYIPFEPLLSTSLQPSTYLPDL